MKKKLISIVAAVITVFSLITCAFADNPTTGSIMVTNALKDTTYALYRAFDVTYMTDADGQKHLNYTIDTTEGNVEEKAKKLALVAAIKAEESDNGYEADGVTPKAAPICSFNATEGESGVYNITQKTDFPESTGRGWLKSQLSNLIKQDEKTATDETVVFSNIPLGYYLVTSTTNGTQGSIVSVTANTPDGTVIDKNERKPQYVEKTTDVYSAETGSEVEFTSDFFATNFRVKDASGDMYDSARIMNYTLTDTSVLGLDFLSSTADTVFGDANGSIAIYTEKQNDGSFLEEDKLTCDGTTYPEIEFTYDPSTHKLVITWGDTSADGTTTSRYPSNVWIVLKYKMKVNDDVYDGDLTNGYTLSDAVNKIFVQMKLEDSPTLETVGEDTAKVHSAAISIRKVDGTIQDTKLAGAKFVLYKTVKSATAGAADEILYWKWNNDTIEWVSNLSNATVVEADNSTSTAEFYALEEGIYKIREVNAPDGYSLPSSDFSVTIAKNTDETEVNNGQYFVITVDSVETVYNGYGIYTTVVKNTKGTNLPTTGGIGTTIFYVVGGVFLVGAFVLLVTKKRMGE